MMKMPILQSRLNPPSPPGNFIARSKLMDRLSDGRDGKLILLSAPAGYGKTTLVGQWLRQQDSPFVWISADSIHRDLRVFMQYFLSALGKRFTTFNQPFWQIPLLQTEWDPKYTIGHLINTVMDEDLRFILVIDDYHLLDSAGINGLITFLLDNLPSQVKLVITSRTDPRLSLAAHAGEA